MNKIIINQINENTDHKLDINIDIIFEFLNGTCNKINYKYNLSMLDFDFYYIGNTWLPFKVENTEEYLIYMSKVDSINNIINLYTNIYDGININDAVIIYRKNLGCHYIGRLENQKIYLSEKNKKLYSYFINILHFYKKIFNKNVICNIYWLDTAFQAVSFPHVVILSEKYLKRPKTYLYKFLPHEIFHQINGCYLKFFGKAKEWMRESFVEYLQLIFLKESINLKFFLDQLDEYRELEMKWSNCGVSIYDFNFKEHMKQYNQVIYGRGVVVFYEIFGENINSIREFMQLLYSLVGLIDIETYINNIEKASGIKKEAIMQKLNMKLLQ